MNWFLKLWNSLARDTLNFRVTDAVLHRGGPMGNWPEQTL